MDCSIFRRDFCLPASPAALGCVGVYRRTPSSTSVIAPQTKGRDEVLRAVIDSVSISGSPDKGRMVRAAADSLVVNARAERSGACYPGVSVVVRIGELSRGLRWHTSYSDD